MESSRSLDLPAVTCRRALDIFIKFTRFRLPRHLVYWIPLDPAPENQSYILGALEPRMLEDLGKLIATSHCIFFHQNGS